MKCPEREKLSAYADGELAPDESKLIAKHLATCAACRSHADAIRRLDSLLVELPSVNSSPSLSAELARRLERKSFARLFFGVPALRYAAAAAMFLLVVGVSLWTFTPPRIKVAEADLPNLNLMADPSFLGIGQFTTGISRSLEVEVSVFDFSEKER